MAPVLLKNGLNIAGCHKFVLTMNLVSLAVFKENGLLPIESKKYFNARKLIRFQDGRSYAPMIEIAICLSCNEYTPEKTSKL